MLVGKAVRSKKVDKVKKVRRVFLVCMPHTEQSVLEIRDFLEQGAFLFPLMRHRMLWASGNPLLSHHANAVTGCPSVPQVARKAVGAHGC